MSEFFINELSLLTREAFLMISAFLGGALIIVFGPILIFLNIFIIPTHNPYQAIWLRLWRLQLFPHILHEFAIAVLFALLIRFISVQSFIFDGVIKDGFSFFLNFLHKFVGYLVDFVVYSANQSFKLARV